MLLADYEALAFIYFCFSFFENKQKLKGKKGLKTF